MERLLVASFKGDPEFEGFEPQVFDDPINGRGMRVLRYRKDGMVDVYWQPGVRVDRTTFAVGAGIGDFAEVAIEPACFEITQSSLDLQIGFTDAKGRRVELRVHEDIQSKRGSRCLLLWVPMSGSRQDSCLYSWRVSTLSVAQGLCLKDESVIACCVRHLYLSYWIGSGCCSYAMLQSR